MESRIARRSKQKNQDKFKRHIASFGSTDSGNNSEDISVSESKPGESDGANSNPKPFPPIRQQLRNVRPEERQRTGRSLTRAPSGPNSRSSSVSSGASEEPGRIKSNARTGRSLSRSGSVDSKGSGPNRDLTRVTSSNFKPPVSAITSVPSNVSVDIKGSTASSNLSKSKQFARSRHRRIRGSSLNRKESQDAANVATDSSETANDATGRKVSAFSKLLAEKQVGEKNTKVAAAAKPFKAALANAGTTKNRSLQSRQNSTKVVETNSSETANNDEPVRKLSSYSRMLAKKQRLVPQKKPKNYEITSKEAAVTPSPSEDVAGTNDATKSTESTDTKEALTPSSSENELDSHDATKSTESTDTKEAVTPSSSENELDTHDATKSTESTDTRVAVTPPSSEDILGTNDATKSTESIDTKVAVSSLSSENESYTNDAAETQETELRSPSVSCDASKIEEDIVVSEKSPKAESTEDPLVEVGDANSVPQNMSPRNENPGKSVLIDEYGSLNVSVLSTENVEKHTSISRNEIEDEYGDPPLEEMESEVTVSTNVENYLPSQSILATLVTSPVHEVPTPLSSVHETKEVFADVDNADNKAALDVETTDTIIEEKRELISDEKKEPDDGKEIAFATDWALSSADFPKFGSPKLPADTQFSDSSFQNTEDAKGDEENCNGTSVNESPKNALKIPGIPISKDYDMFDTSSWAEGSVTGFSNTSISKVDVDINAEKNFVKMMKEEMEFRTLTEEEQKMMFEANESINQAEEKAKKEQNTAVKDDEPLLISNDTNAGISLEDRLKSYAVVENDEDSIDSSDEENGSDEDDSEQDAAVEYVGQNNEGEEQDQVEADGSEAPINLVSSNDVPTLEVAASAASMSSAADVYIPKTLEELKMAGPPPPPPPPGLPKKKKKKKKTKSKPKSDSRTSNNAIPLIAPPSEEKLKKWKDGQKNAQSSVTALAEGLANSANKTLDESSEYFHFKPVDRSKENKETDGVKEASDQKEGSTGEDPRSTEDKLKEQSVDDNLNIEFDKKKETEQETILENTIPMDQGIGDGNSTRSDTTEKDSVTEFAMKVQRENEKIVSLHTEPKNNLWRKEVADAIGLVERLQEEYDTEEYPDIALFPSPFSDEDIAKKNSAETDASSQKTDLVGEDTLLLKVDDITQEETSNQLSLFSSPKSAARSAKPNGFNEKTKSLSNSKSVLTDPKMADKVAMASSAAANTFEERYSPRNSGNKTAKENIPKEFESLAWFSTEVIKKKWNTQASEVDVSKAARTLLENDEHFNCMCRFVANSVNDVSLGLDPNLKSCDSTLECMSKTLSRSKSGEQLKTLSREDIGDDSTMNTMSTASSGDSSGHNRVLLKPVVLSQASIKLSSKYLAANFVSFIYMASKLANVSSPFGEKNPFLALIVDTSLEETGGEEPPKTAQDLLFEELDGRAEKIIDFVFELNSACDAEIKVLNAVDQIHANDEVVEVPSIVRKVHDFSGKRFIVPESHPSPFEACVSEAPRILAAVLSFLGDPVALCRMKKINKHCLSIVKENEHNMMQDAVRTGGMEARHRPAFWLWVALEKSDASIRENKFVGNDEMTKLKTEAEEGQWHHVIQRDVDRSFGNMPPHKTGSTSESDSIVTALVTWGQNRLMKRGVKGGGEPVPTPDVGEQKQNVKRKSTNISSPPWKRGEIEGNNDENPTTTVSDWGAVSPQGSFVGSVKDTDDRASTDIDSSMEEVALSGNSLSADMKVDLQKKLNYILHILAATYEDIGYCQGMDYVVAYLLRNLQDTIKWKAANERLPSIISTSFALNITEDITALNNDIDSNHVIEETIIRVMDTFFVNYNLKHMYWPELRCLKTFCRVFERLVQIKLPVLADHFEHHDLNIGLFALGWFQTLFLYLPSMPSATVCHMWDIWLVERSFKIFFRVGTAILFLSQPILLNHELEGMMTYLNTIPDATLLRRDILIPCALNIKVTNQLLQQLEDEVMKNPN